MNIESEKVYTIPSVTQDEFQAAQEAIAKVETAIKAEEALSASSPPMPPPNPYEDRVYQLVDTSKAYKLPILLYPDKRLEQVSTAVKHFGSSLGQVAANLVATAAAADAAGLSAIQVGVNLRVMAIRVSKERKFIVLVNPSFVELSLDDMVSVDEGCLSFPGVREKVQRARKVKVTYQDLKGEHQKMELVVDDPATYVAAQAVQHEYEHLDGLLLLANLNFIHRDRVRLHMKRVNRKLEAIMKKSNFKLSPMQVLFGYTPEPEPDTNRAEEV